MKKLERKNLAAVYMLAIALTFPLCMNTVYATSLDDIVNEQSQTVETQTETTTGQTTEQPTEAPAQNTTNDTTEKTSDTSGYVDTTTWINEMKDATNYTQPNEASTKINQSVKKVASIVVQVLSYAVTALLAVRVLLDLLYIAIPFTRSILANGYAGNAQAGGGMNMMNGGMGQPGMGMGMGMNGGFGGGFGGGYGSGFGMNRMGMGGMGMGMNGMGMQQGQMGATPALGRIQWISNAALNAVAAEGVPNQNGSSNSALKIYSKDMMIILVITPVLIILAVSGALTNLGFLIGDAIARMVAGVGGMV